VSISDEEVKEQTEESTHRHRIQNNDTAKRPGADSNVTKPLETQIVTSWMSPRTQNQRSTHLSQEELRV
jgi:hypothetical protein